jgi:hypothetical protein
MRRESSTINTVGLAAGAPGWDIDIALFFISIPQNMPVRVLVYASPGLISVGQEKNFMNSFTKRWFAAGEPRSPG